jgi:hypothetical protein
MNLQAIHPEIVAMPIGMLRVDERQRDERTSILGPCGHRWQPIEPDITRDHVGDRTTASAPGTDTQHLEPSVTGGPQFPGGRRKQGLRQLHEAPDESERARAEREFRTAGRSKEIRDERKVCAGDVTEHECRAARGNHPPMDLRSFLVWIDRHVDVDHIAIAFEVCEERTEIGERHALIL